MSTLHAPSLDLTFESDLLSVLLFVFWYCHKRGRETRLEKEGLAAQEADSALASSASSFTEDAESRSQNAEASSSSKEKGDEKAEPPLIISDSREDPQQTTATVDDLPSVLNLPDPNTAPLPDTPAKEK